MEFGATADLHLLGYSIPRSTLHPPERFGAGLQERGGLDLLLVSNRHYGWKLNKGLLTHAEALVENRTHKFELVNASQRDFVLGGELGTYLADHLVVRIRVLQEIEGGSA